MIDNKLKEIAKHLKIRFPNAEFSKNLGFSKGVVSEYLNNKKNASENFLEALENYYKIDYRKLVNFLSNKTNSSIDDKFMLNLLEKSTPINSVNENKLEYELSPVKIEDMHIMNVPLVHVYAYAGYLNGFGDEQYFQDLPRVPWLNNREGKGNYLCFEVMGDSMDDGSYESYLENDILLCREVKKEHWTSKLHINKWDFVIVHKEDGIILKRIIKHDVDKCEITTHSLNSFYEDKIIHLKDVSQIFNVVDFKRKKRR